MGRLFLSKNAAVAVAQAHHHCWIILSMVMNRLTVSVKKWCPWAHMCSLNFWPMAPMTTNEPSVSPMKPYRYSWLVWLSLPKNAPKTLVRTHCCWWRTCSIEHLLVGMLVAIHQQLLSAVIIGPFKGISSISLEKHKAHSWPLGYSSVAIIGPSKGISSIFW